MQRPARTRRRPPARSRRAPFRRRRRRRGSKDQAHAPGGELADLGVREQRCEPRALFLETGADPVPDLGRRFAGRRGRAGRGRDRRRTERRGGRASRGRRRPAPPRRRRRRMARPGAGPAGGAADDGAADDGAGAESRRAAAGGAVRATRQPALQPLEPLEQIADRLQRLGWTEVAAAISRISRGLCDFAASSIARAQRSKSTPAIRPPRRRVALRASPRASSSSSGVASTRSAASATRPDDLQVAQEPQERARELAEVDAHVGRARDDRSAAPGSRSSTAPPARPGPAGRPRRAPRRRCRA